jgi:hypothetical protein
MLVTCVNKSINQSEDYINYLNVLALYKLYDSEVIY